MILVFAYGSNLSLARMRERAPEARVVVTGYVEGHDLRFHKIGRDGSGKADCLWTARADDRVHGVVYEVGRSGKRRLDRAESLGSGYFEKRVDVIDSTRASSIPALLYVANPEMTDARLRPYSWYLALVTEGARAHGLPQPWCRRLEATAVWEDPDRERHRRHLSLAGVPSAGLRR